MKSQNESISQGGAPGSTTPYDATQFPVPGWPTSLPYTPVPTPIVGLESSTAYSTWEIINVTQGCSDEFYGWVSNLDSGGNPILNIEGNPTGQATAPCDSPDCVGLPIGTVWTTDYEDIASTNRQKRDTALKAKNEFLLVTESFYLSNESFPFYNINKEINGVPCISNCGQECDCSGTKGITELPCPTVEEISLSLWNGFTLVNGIESEKCCSKEYTGSILPSPPVWGQLSDLGFKCYVDYIVDNISK